MNCLVINPPQKKIPEELDLFFRERSVLITEIGDPLAGIRKAQEQHFDVILVDARVQGARIVRTLELLKGCDPQARIIVHTQENTRHLESQVRRQKIYYYHVDSFGLQDLQMAISAALGI